MSVLNTILTRLYMRHLLATPAGQAHLLNQIAEAEDSGEARVFDEALAQVKDEKLQKMIQRHRDDEIRHGQMFHEAVRRTGVDPGPVPAELRVLDRIDEKLGGFFSREIKDDHGVMMAYLILQVIEERAIEQFTIFEKAFRKTDPRTADIFVEVARDEERHLKYCEAISKRYAPDEATLDRELKRLRGIEAEAQRETERANTIHALEHGLFGSPTVRWFWRNMMRVGDRLDVLPYTRFALQS